MPGTDIYRHALRGAVPAPCVRGAGGRAIEAGWVSFDTPGVQQGGPSGSPQFPFFSASRTVPRDRSCSCQMAIGYPPTAVGSPPTAVGYPPTAVGYPPTAVGHPPTAIGHPPTAVGYPPTAVGYPPTAVGSPPTAVGYPPTAVGYPPTAVSHPPTAIGHPPTAVGYPPTAVGYPPTAIGYPPTAIGYPPTAVGYPPTVELYLTDASIIFSLALRDRSGAQCHAFCVNCVGVEAIRSDVVRGAGGGVPTHGSAKRWCGYVWIARRKYRCLPPLARSRDPTRDTRHTPSLPLPTERRPWSLLSHVSWFVCLCPVIRSLLIGTQRRTRGAVLGVPVPELTNCSLPPPLASLWRSPLCRRIQSIPDRDVERVPSITSAVRKPRVTQGPRGFRATLLVRISGVLLFRAWRCDGWESALRAPRCGWA